MTAPFQNQAFVGWTRFRHGDFQCTVVTDGPMNIGSPANGFPKADPREIIELLASAFLPTDSMTLDQNLLIVNTGQNLVLFDTGCGVNHAFGKSSFGPQIGAEIGRAIPNLRAAGIDPKEIDVVALTHAHPDHCWGLVDDGNRLYPNAKIAISIPNLAVARCFSDKAFLKDCLVSAIDYNYWTDLSRIPEALTQHRKNHFSGACYNLLPYGDSLIFIEDNPEVVPGIRAMAATGYSPGHYVYAIQSLGRTLINIGDLSHHHILLLKRPHWEFRFDFDPIKAAETRIWHFDRIAQERHSILACHFPFPGLGHLRKDRDGYTWVATATPIDLGSKTQPSVPTC